MLYLLILKRTVGVLFNILLVDLVFGSDYMEQIKMTVILNIDEVETSSMAELVRRRREFTEMSDYHVF